MNDAPDRELWHRAMDDYRKAHAIAAAVWGSTVPPEVLQSATATILLHAKDLRRSGGQSPVLAHPAPAGEAPPRCPVCESAMRDQRATKRGNQPDYKCVVRSCDGAMWLDRKRNGTHP